MFPLDIASPTINGYQRFYSKGEMSAEQFLLALWETLENAGCGPDGDSAWIYLPSAQQREALLDHLRSLDRATCPLWGVPFAVKDNIDIAGWPTTAACPAYAYEAQRSATVVRALMQAGAIPVGKTNLDQFATGLVGTRSPYGWVPNTFSDAHISGGSSSGSASVVARGLVCFSLGTDTAGSGRIPAGFNNLVGTKPTPGLFSTQGVVPACQTVDCVSIMSLTVADASRILEIMASFSEAQTDDVSYHPPVAKPIYAFPHKLRVGIVKDPVFTTPAYEPLYAKAVESVTSLGATVCPVDMSLMNDVAGQLYSGPWVAERLVTARKLLETDPDALDATVRQVIQKGEEFSAADAFSSLYQVRELASKIRTIWDELDVLLVPTAPGLPTYADVCAQPIVANTALGRYTNFVNLLGWAALATPAGFTPDGLPFGITWIGPGGSDRALLNLGARWQAGQQVTFGRGLNCDDDESLTSLARPDASHAMVVVGAHLKGMPLHWQLEQIGARLVSATHTSANYRLYALANTTPAKPGLCRVNENGASIAVEVYDVPPWGISAFLAQIPSPLGLGQVELVNGQWVTGFICEPWALGEAKDVTEFGGWRAYLSEPPT